MKKNNWILILFLMIGLLTGSLLSHWLGSVPGLSFLTKSEGITWEPKADLNVLRYDLFLEVKLNLFSILGMIAAFWIYRKL